MVSSDNSNTSGCDGFVLELPSRASLLRRMGVSESDVPYYLTVDNLPDAETVEKECGEAVRAVSQDYQKAPF